MSEMRPIPVRTMFEAITARMRVREFARVNGFDVTGQARISLAAYLLAKVPEPRGVTRRQLITDLLEEDKRVGIRVSCVMDSIVSYLVPEVLANMRWLVDESRADTLPSGEIMITLTHWSPSEEHHPVTPVTTTERVSSP